MCRYAFNTYKSHFACFACRKAFKKVSMEDWVATTGLKDPYRRLSLNQHPIEKREEIEKAVGYTLEEINKRYLDELSSCPDCNGTMAAMGLDFKAPPKKDKEAWEIIQILYSEGFAFKGCGCSVGYSPPSRKSELSDFFAEHKRKSEGQQLLEKIEIKNT